jgi:hypothetical protein
LDTHAAHSMHARLLQAFPSAEAIWFEQDDFALLFSFPWQLDELEQALDLAIAWPIAQSKPTTHAAAPLQYQFVEAKRQVASQQTLAEWVWQNQQQLPASGAAAQPL